MSLKVSTYRLRRDLVRAITAAANTQGLLIVSTTQPPLRASKQRPAMFTIGTDYAKGLRVRVSGPSGITNSTSVTLADLPHFLAVHFNNNGKL